MVYKCSVKHCRNESSMPGISLHKMLHHTSLQMVLCALFPSGYEPGASFRVCNVHFTENSFVNDCEYLSILLELMLITLSRFRLPQQPEIAHTWSKSYSAAVLC